MSGFSRPIDGTRLLRKRIRDKLSGACSEFDKRDLAADRRDAVAENR
jgi:hypothetical protein